MADFETEQLTTRDIFSDNSVYEFPLYQRPYRWDERQAGALLHDLQDACAAHASGEDSDTYFIGSMVLVRQPGTRSNLVIDGRQRLTTLAILLATLRDLEDNAQDRADLHRMLCDVGSTVRNIAAGPRLRVQGLDGEGLSRWVLDDGATSNAPDENEGLSERMENVVDVAALFRNTLSQLDRASRARLRDFVLHKCEIVAVISPNRDKGLRIFQVLNTRGLALSDVDLIKPDLLTLLPTGDRDFAAEKFDEAEVALGSRDMAALLRAIYFIAKQEVAPERRDRFHEAFISCVKSGDARRTILEEIPLYGQIFAKMKSRELPAATNNKDPNIIFHSLRWLGWDSEDWLPVALAIVRNALNDAELAYRHLLLLEQACYFGFITINNERAGRKTRRDIFARAVASLMSGSSKGDPDSLVLGSALKQQMSDALSQSFYTFQQRGALLRRVEAAMSGDSLDRIDDSSVIHILPPKFQKNSEWAAHFTAKTHRETANLLGNLTLVDKGREYIAHRSFEDKKRLLHTKRRPFAIQADLVRANNWTPDAIRARTENMAKVLRREWQLP